MTGLAFGLAAALLWGLSAAVGGRVARAIGSRASIVLTTSVCMIVILPAALLSDSVPHRLHDWLVAAAAGAFYIIGVVCWTRGVTRASVGLVTTLVSTDGAVAAVLAVALGESISRGAGVALAIVVVGILLSTRSTSVEHESISPSAIAYGLGGAVAFGAVFVVSAHAGEASALWVTTIGRGVAMVLVLPMVRHVRLPARPLVPLLLFAAVADVAGYTIYIVGSRHGVATMSVLTSQYALIAAIAGRVLYGERLSRTQRLGVVTTLVGVGVLAIAGT